MGFRRVLLSFLMLLAAACSAPAAERALRVAVLSNSPPMSYVDVVGNLAGFNVGVARAVCEAMEARCELSIVSLDRVVGAVAAGEFDFASVSLLDTPERRTQVLFTKPYFRSNSVWFARPGVEPGGAQVRVATVAGSVQSRFAENHGWKVVTVRNHSELPARLVRDEADAILVPMSTSLTLRQDKSIQSLGLVTSIMRQRELSGDVCMAVHPGNPDLRDKLDQAIDQIKRDGRFDRLNTEYLPFRLQ